jgi:NADH dehydrogenase
VLAHRILPSEYRSINTHNARIVLVDAANSVLMTFPGQLQEQARKDLCKLGVEVQTGAQAVEIDDHGITLVDPNSNETTRILARTVVWAAGVSASPLGRQLAERIDDPAIVDRAGRVIVEDDCSVPGHPNIFVIGDLAYVEGVPGVAQPAMQEGRYVGRVIRARLNGGSTPPPFRYRDKGNMATIGRTRAVAEIKGVNVTGFIAYVMWAFVHIAYLVGWGNRFEAIMRWMWALFARNRRERLISIASLQQAPGEGRSKDVE